MSKIAIITGSNGLIGSECVSFFADKFDLIIGVDNDMRSYYFGYSGSTRLHGNYLSEKYSNYKNKEVDIRDYSSLEMLFKQYGNDIELIIHTAAQPSHDWAAKEPLTDFGVNATGTANLLELTRLFCPKACFVQCSTNKVYGDTPNYLPLIETETRFEIENDHQYHNGIDETMSIDNSKHSLFGASKVAADIMTQEYGKYFGMNTGIFRGGCLTGGSHKGTEQHGFLSYLVKCAVERIPYTIFGNGLQVRDNVDAFDVATLFNEFYKNPKQGEVYNIGGGRENSVSIFEAIGIINEILKVNSRPEWDNYSVLKDEWRSGDHKWYISDTSKAKKDFPCWGGITKNIKQIMIEIYENTIKQ